MKQFLGIDIGGTNVKFGLVDSKGVLLEKTKHKTAQLTASGDFLTSFGDVLEEQLLRHKNIKDIGIGIPGLLTKNRKSTVKLQNIPSLDGVNLHDYLSNRFKKHHFHLENDANAALIGEYYFSETPLPENVLMLTLGTGVGGGAMIDGKIFKGGEGNGMEVGHIMATHKKTVEDLVGKKGLVKQAKKLLKKKSTDSKLRNKKHFSAKDVEKAAFDGDPIAIKAYKKLGKTLGSCIVSSMRILDINTIILGGGVADTYTFFSESMYKQINKFIGPYYTEDLDIRIASLANEAGIIGAAALCFLDEPAESKTAQKSK